MDYEEKIIIDQSVIDNQKAKCVFDKLKNLSNTIFNDIINNHFQSSSSSILKFEIGSMPAQLPDLNAFTYTTYNAANNTNQDGIINVRLSPTFVQNASAIEIALAFIHESIHAELLDRCIQLGIIQEVGLLGEITFTDSPNSFNLPDIVFNQLVLHYKNFNGGSQWQHDLFTVSNYREEMAQNLVDVHPWLNDNGNDFLSNVNSDQFNFYGDFTIDQLMNYVTWIGLEETQEFINTVQNNPLEHTKKNYVENASRAHYTNNCN